MSGLRTFLQFGVDQIEHIRMPPNGYNEPVMRLAFWDSKFFNRDRVAERLCENYRCDQKTAKVAGFFASLVELNHKYIAFTK